MPFRLSNVLSAFQPLINKIFADLLDIFVVIYLNNILIYSNNLLEYKKHIKEILHCLRKNSLYAFSTKCIFYQHKIEFLGFILGPDGIQIDGDKV